MALQPDTCLNKNYSLFYSRSRQLFIMSIKVFQDNTFPRHVSDLMNLMHMVVFSGSDGDESWTNYLTLKQKEYVDAMRRFDVVFAIGPAGTGKTYLAMAMALAALKRKEVERIFISRPVVEAGENLGFLPGDLQEKIDPYLRPIFDAMRAMVGRTSMQKMIETGVVEITPLAYMRGRTLNDCFAVLDEAQNSTVGQMKMFLTRLGANAKAVVTGDITQIDLSDPGASGLVAVRNILDGVEGIKFITFGEEDVVRHRLVKRIIRAFDKMGMKMAETQESQQVASAGGPAEERSEPSNG